MARALVPPIPAPATLADLADFERALTEAAGWVQAEIPGAMPFLDVVAATSVDIGEVAAVDADPPVALLGVAVIVFIFGAGLLINAVASLFAVLPWPLNHLAAGTRAVGNRVIQYGLDIVEWMVRPLIQLAQSVWRGIDKLFGLGLATSASLARAIYRHIHVIGPHQIAANDTYIALESARAINQIIAVAPDYEMKAVKAGHTAVSDLMRSIPKLVPATAAAAVGALATAVSANTTVIDECALPWCDTLHTARQVEDALRGALGGLLGAALFCEAVSHPADAARAVADASGALMASLAADAVTAGDPFGAAMIGLYGAMVSDPAGAASIITSNVCG